MRGPTTAAAGRFLARQQKVQEALPARRLDALLIANLSNIRYLFNFTGSTALALITRRKAYLVVDSRYMTQAGQETHHAKLVLSTPRPNEDALVCLLRRLRPARLGFESRSLSHFLFAHFREQLRKYTRLVPTEFIVEKVRTVKDAVEVESIRQALRLTWETFDRFLPTVRPGVSEKDLAIELEYQLLRNGAAKLSFDTILVSGVRSAMPHGKPSTKKIGHREFVTFDFGVYLDGYASDMTRTAFVGTPGAAERQIYNTVREAVERAEADARPGMKGVEIDALARRYIKDRGFGPYFGHATGHGIGLDVHEQPWISTRGKEPVTPDMVFTIEPGIYVPETGGVRIEDVVVMTRSGCEVMTQYPKELICL